MALKAGRVGVKPSEVTKGGKIKGGGGSPYVLPVANVTTLGGVKPVTKTEAMTKEVGVDSEGRLYVEPSEGGSTNILSGTDPPAISLGEDGDVYLRDLDTDFVSANGDDYVLLNSLAKMCANHSFEIKFGALGKSSDYEYICASAFSPATSKGFRAIRFSNTGALQIVWTATTSDSLQFYTSPDLTRDDFINDFHVVKVDGAEVYIDGFLVHTFTGTVGDMPFNYWAFFALNASPAWQYPAKARIVYFKEWDENGNLVKYVVPEYSNDTWKVRDEVSGNSYPPTSGTFGGALAGYIFNAYCKVNGAWQLLIGTNIDDVNTGEPTI